MPSALVNITKHGITDMVRDEIEPWLQNEVLNPARGIAVRLVNIDSGNLRSSIYTEIERLNPLTINGILGASANYAVWQETEPGDDIPGIGTRQRRGGKPFLRPAINQVLSSLR